MLLRLSFEDRSFTTLGRADPWDGSLDSTIPAVSQQTVPLSSCRDKTSVTTASLIWLLLGCGLTAGVAGLYRDLNGVSHAVVLELCCLVMLLTGLTLGLA